MRFLSAFRIFFVFSFTISAFVRADDNDISAADLKIAQKQVAQTFSQKFKKVTPDIARSSRANLAAIESALRHRIGDSEFERLWGESERRAEDSRKHLVFQSETSYAGAVKILQSGSFYSLDEMIRRKIIPIKRKVNTASHLMIDGIIGQQDTVYLAIKPDDIPRARMGVSWMFGPVKFIFSESVANRGYFTPYTFDNSPRAYNLWYPDEKRSLHLAEALSLYRQFVFTGVSGYKRLLRLSAVHLLWENGRKDAFPFRALENANRNVNREESLCEVMKYFGQPCNSPFQVGIEDILARSQASRRKGEHGPHYDLIGAFTSFPMAQGEIGISQASLFGFWELKVPARLPLDEVVAIEVSNPDGYLTPEILRDLTKAVRTFALRNGRNVKVSKRFDQISYDYESGNNPRELPRFDVTRFDLARP